MTSPYTKLKNRKRKWTPIEVTKGKLLEGSEETFYRALALRTLELPVKEMLEQGLAKELPNIDGCEEALRSNQKDEDKHDLAFNYLVNAHGVDEKSEREAVVIRKTWLEAPEHPILKTAVLERSVFFVLLPFYRYCGDMAARSISQDISGDESIHVLQHQMVCKDLGIDNSKNLDNLRRQTVAWVMDTLGNSDNKYLNKDFWINTSDSLYRSGKANLKETKRSRMPAFFESDNRDLPSYG